jgi:hypothetical protein
MGAWSCSITGMLADRWTRTVPTSTAPQLARGLGSNAASPARSIRGVVGLNTVSPQSGRPLNLGTANVDHLMLTGAGWIMADAKGIGQGRLLIEHGHGVLVTPDGQRRPQPWLDDARAYSRAGVMSDLTGGKRGVMVWVLPDGVDASHPSMLHPPCLREGSYGYMLSVSELAAGELESISELPTPYPPADPADVARLTRHVSDQAPT